MADKGVVHRDVGAVTRFAVIGSQTRGFHDRGLGDLFAAGDDNDVRAVDLLGVQPEVVFRRCFQGQAVVLAVVSADQDREAVRGGEFQRRQGALLCLLALGLAQIALLGQFLADLRELALGLGAADGIEDGIQVFQLLLALLDLLGQEDLGVLRLLVVLVIFLGVRRRGYRRIQLDPQRRAVFVVIVLHVGIACAARNAVEIRLQQIAADAQLFTVGALAQLGVLLLQLARRAVAEIGQ